MPQRFARSAVRTACLVCIGLTCWFPPAHSARAHDVPGEMAEAGRLFALSLDQSQRNEALLPFDSPRRTFWHYVPSASLESQGGRPGLAMKQMTPEQRALAHALLSTALSHRGYRQSMTIVMLESVLHDLENGNPIRDPGMYHLSIFGQPSTTKTWGWSLEGHHLSVRAMLVDGQRISVTPSFFGSNPGIVRDGVFRGVEVLADEQQMARQLVNSLTAEQRKLAIIAEVAPRDIVTRNEPKIGIGDFTPPQGIRYESLNPSQQTKLLALVRLFTEKYRPEILEDVNSRKPIAEGPGMVFAWAGSLKAGAGHYYRVQTPHFLFEYDNTQGGANHVHTVWREFDGDFGEDLLREHYRSSAHHHREPSPGSAR